MQDMLFRRRTLRTKDIIGPIGYTDHAEARFIKNPDPEVRPEAEITLKYMRRHGIGNTLPPYRFDNSDLAIPFLDMAPDTAPQMKLHVQA